uniref:Uncharacterized protein n=1 Tax=Arundo donax TaxID=35708 RepID=A0A0A9DYB6_ARUDO
MFLKFSFLIYFRESLHGISLELLLLFSAFGTASLENQNLEPCQTGP